MEPLIIYEKLVLLIFFLSLRAGQFDSVFCVFCVLTIISRTSISKFDKFDKFDDFELLTVLLFALSLGSSSVCSDILFREH